MNRRTLLRLAICNLLLIGVLSISYVISNLNVKASYAAAQDFPSQYFAPNVDATLAGNPFPDVISQTSKIAGTKYYELGFITASKGQCQGLWGGVNSLTYMQGDIANLRASGGDIILNFGGYVADNPDDPSVDPQQQEELALACPTVASLRAQYQNAITAYHATHVAFAIEGDALSNPKYAVSISLRNLAIAGLKSGVPGTPLCVEFTLTGTTTGLTDQGEILLEDAIDKGVHVCLVNILAMNYGSSAPVNQPGAMGQYAVDAAQEAFFQLKFLFPTLSDSQIWSMMGVTIMNGVNNASGQGGREIFSLADAQMVLQFALKNKIRELSMWELHRDRPPSGGVIAPMDTVTATPTLNSGILQTPYTFSTAFNTFTSSLTCPPGQVSVVGIPPANGSITSPPSGIVAPPSNVNVTGSNPNATPGVIPLGSTNQTERSQAKENRTSMINLNCVVNPNSSSNPGGIPNPIGISGLNCTTNVNSNQNVPLLPASNKQSSQPKVGRLPPNIPLSNSSSRTTLLTKSAPDNPSLALAITKSSSQLQVGQQVAYTLTPCHLTSVDNALIVISDTLSAGLVGLKSTTNNWQIIYNYAFGNGSITIIALYTGPRTIASDSTLPPFTFSGVLTAAAIPRLTSFGLVATIDGPSGSLGPLGSSGSLGALGLSLNAKITSWAAAMDALFVQ